jgi:hypothetical protein
MISESRLLCSSSLLVWMSGAGNIGADMGVKVTSIDPDIATRSKQSPYHHEVHSWLTRVAPNTPNLVFVVQTPDGTQLGEDWRKGVQAVPISETKSSGIQNRGRLLFSGTIWATLSRMSEKPVANMTASASRRDPSLRWTPLLSNRETSMPDLSFICGNNPVL